MSKQQDQNQNSLQYTGKSQPPQKGDKDSNQREYFPYLPSHDLIEAVNLAIALERPLLLEGEPGCGKTRLAGAVAYEFTRRYSQEKEHKNVEQEDKNRVTITIEQTRDNNQSCQQILTFWNYYIWNVKSTTPARDGLYIYDAVARLRDAQLMGTNPQQLKEFIGYTETEQFKRRLWNKKNYREFGALGKALQKHERRPILLIDEIDKADSDFANDLLLELEELRFEIPETGESFPPPKQKPIIFITSNREKPLPEPFLRRCLYFFVTFPNTEQLKEIINNRFGKFDEKQEEVVTKAIERFEKIRKLLADSPGSKPPGTSEFLEFLTVLLHRENALQDLNDLSQKLPLLGTLLKTKQDQKLYQKE